MPTTAPVQPVKVSNMRRLGRALAQKNMLISMLMGFSSGMPLLLSSRTLQLWMSYLGGSNALVGYVALISLPYSLKFLWAPLMDRYKILPLGRRRGWLLVTQIGAFAAIWLLSTIDPVKEIKLTACFAVLLAFMSASQDIVVDAYRREVLSDEEIGLGASFYNMGYRVAMWTTGGLAVILAGSLSWATVYRLVSVGLVVGIVTTLWAKEPKEGAHTPKTIEQAVWLPLRDFFQRDHSIVILCFLLLYKLGDSMATNMFGKFYVQLGFTPQEIGVVAKSLTPFSTSIGGFLGGALMLRLGILRSLFLFGAFQALSTSMYSMLDLAGHSIPMLGAVVFFEDFSNGMNSAALIAYLSTLTNRNFTATQYALFASLAAVPRTFISAVSGHLVDVFGFGGFFIFCAIMALPGLGLLYYLHKTQKPIAAT